jgi:hypothetical protein
MNQQDSKKRTLISFGLALAASLMSIYIQNHTETKALEKQSFELKVSAVEDHLQVKSLN